MKANFGKKRLFSSKIANLLLKTPNGYVIILTRLRKYRILDFFDRVTISFPNAKGIVELNINDTCVDLVLREKEKNLQGYGRSIMANVRDAANYLVRLYYYGNKNCTSAAIQKLLIIAQMRSIHKFNKPLFEDDLIVKPSCFSIKIISTTYPDVIFNESSRDLLKDDYSQDVFANIPVFDNSSKELSTFYDYLGQLNLDETKIIQDTYKKFGSFSGKCVGEFMKTLTLHQRKEKISTLTVDEMCDYLKNIPVEDKTNPIISFICDENL